MKRENKQKRKGKNQRFHQLWEKFKNHHQTEGYELKEVFDIYLPFWHCKQNIVVERDVELDRFSRIILELLQNNITKYSEICAFLGIDEDDFVTIQFHFLLKNDLIRELGDNSFELTHEGISFLENKKKIKNMETTEFEYFLPERINYLKNDLTQEFFNPMLPIDKELLSEQRKTSFSGYKVMHSDRITESKTSQKIPHKYKPTYRQISDDRNAFAKFYDQTNQDKIFYDFADTKIRPKERNICFYGLLYEKTDNEEDKKLDIRHSSKSVRLFKNNNLENTLSAKATTYLNQHPDFIRFEK